MGKKNKTSKADPVSTRKRAKKICDAFQSRSIEEVVRALPKGLIPDDYFTELNVDMEYITQTIGRTAKYILKGTFSEE